jgi:hypothetical protein
MYTYTSALNVSTVNNYIWISEKQKLDNMGKRVETILDANVYVYILAQPGVPKGNQIF